MEIAAFLICLYSYLLIHEITLCVSIYSCGLWHIHCLPVIHVLHTYVHKCILCKYMNNKYMHGGFADTYVVYVC